MILIITSGMYYGFLFVRYRLHLQTASITSSLKQMLQKYPTNIYHIEYTIHCMILLSTVFLCCHTIYIRYICMLFPVASGDNCQLQSLSLIYNEKFILYPNRHILLPLISPVTQVLRHLFFGTTLSHRMCFISFRSFAKQPHNLIQNKRSLCLLKTSGAVPSGGASIK